MKTVLLLSITFIIMVTNTTQAQEQLSFTEQLAYSTARLEVETTNGLVTGTAFFFSFTFEDGRSVPVMVTNKHVINDGKRGRFYLTLANSESKTTEIIPVLLDDFESKWTLHPDPKVDLAIMPIAPILQDAEQKKIHVSLKWINENLIPSDSIMESLTAVEDILMVGYPNGIWDKVNNSPICRRGITATHPNKNYLGREEFMIDAACFPGSSGSPIFLYNVGSYMTRRGTNISSRILFLGVLYMGPQHIATGSFEIINVPEKLDTIPVTAIPNNLGNVIKAKKILDFKPLIKAILGKEEAAEGAKIK